MSPKYLLVIGTMDTKGREICYLHNKICEVIQLLQADIKTIVLDVGILGKALEINPDYTPEEICIQAGTSIDYVRNAPNRGIAISRMEECALHLVQHLLAENKCHGIVSLAGSSGATIFRRVAESLPIGMPKMIASPGVDKTL